MYRLRAYLAVLPPQHLDLLLQLPPQLPDIPLPYTKNTITNDMM